MNTKKNKKNHKERILLDRSQQEFIMENKEREQEKGKQKVERGNRQVLGDIGNLEENQISRNSRKKKAEAALEGPANDQGVAQNVGDDWTHKPNPEPVHVASSEAGEKVDLNPEKRERSLSPSPPTKKIKTARRLSIVPENQPVDVDADDNQPVNVDADDNQPINVDADDNQPVDVDADDNQPVNMDADDNQPVDVDADDNQPVDIDADDNQPVDMDSDDNQPVAIDANEANNLLAVEYLDDIYSFYKLTEVANRISDYMESQKEINAKMRTIVVDWLVEVHRVLECKTETLFLTINIMDRYLSLTNNVTKKTFQLVAICSMSLSFKFEEVMHPKVLKSLINGFLDITAKSYNLQQFISMERDIIEKIQWNLTVPTPYVFLVQLIRASIVEDNEMENMAFYLAELGLLHYQVVLFSPSMIAAAAVYSARCVLNRNPYWSQNLENIAGYSKEQINECATLLVRIHANNTNNRTLSLYQKFSSPSKGQIAIFPFPHNIEERL